MTKIAKIAKNVQRKQVAAIARQKGDIISKQPKVKRAELPAWSPIKKVTSKRRVISPPPKKLTFDKPLSDITMPKGCFGEKFVTFQMALQRERDRSEFLKFQQQMRDESLNRCFGKLSVDELTPKVHPPEEEEKQIEYIRIRGERAYICSLCKEKVGSASLDTHAARQHGGAKWTKPCKGGRPVQDEHCERYRQQLAADQNLKWHQDPTLQMTGNQPYYHMFHKDLPYEHCKRQLQNGEIVTIKYRGFNPAPPYGDKVLAETGDFGMDSAMLVHQARLCYDYQDVARYAVHLFDKTHGADINDPRFKMNTLQHLSDPCDGRDREDTNDDDIIKAKRYLDKELYDTFAGGKVADVQTAEDLPEFQPETTEFPTEVVHVQQDIPTAKGHSQDDEDMS